MSQRANEAATGSGISDTSIPRRSRYKAPQDDVTASAGSSGVQLTRRSWTITLQDDDEYYTIREDQLDSLATGGKKLAMEWVFFCGGAALGLLPFLGNVAIALFSNKVVSIMDAGLAAIAIGLSAYAIAKFIEARSTKSDVDALKTKIKAGQKLTVK